MKGDAKIIEHLNLVLANELVAINQYFLHAKMLKNWGLHKLAQFEQGESIDEMKHADALADRILFLEGVPNFQYLGKLYIGENIKEMLQCDLKLEGIACATLIPAIQYAEHIMDYATRTLLVSILESEEKHIDELETQLDLMDKIGLENYIQSQI
jgi:bacterioferritin